jgi:hypothetical protein
MDPFIQDVIKREKLSQNAFYRNQFREKEKAKFNKLRELGAHLFRRVFTINARLGNAHFRAWGAGNPTRLDDAAIRRCVQDVCFCDNEEIELK